MSSQILSNIPLFEGLTSRERMRLTGSLRERSFDAGSMVFHEGDPGDALYVVRSGLVRIYTGGKGTGFETSVILFGRPGDVFGELAVIDGEPRSASAKAMEDTKLYIMGRENFQYHMENMPKLAFNFMSLMSRKMRSSTQHLDSLASQNVSERLANLLIRLMDEFGTPHGDDIVLDINLNQTELASLIGATRESTNRAMRQLKQQHIVQQENGKILVRNYVALRQLSQ
ncbi:MAG: Crp/Fnr family transcriptional regulator [Chloroflexota bacterium]